MCKKVLGEIIGKEVKHIEYPNYEKTIKVRNDSKAVRLDVYVVGEKEVYNIEIQNLSFEYMPKRGRYYQSLIDLDLLEKGKEYNELCRSYVIFICTFDFYGKNQYKYTFTNRCHEIKELEYGDMTTKIILNTKGIEGEASEDLKIFLNAINGVFSNNNFSTTIKREYDKIKENYDMRREYMTLEMELKEQYKAGKAEGRSEFIDILRELKSGKTVEDVAKEFNMEIEEIDEINNLRG